MSRGGFCRSLRVTAVVLWSLTPSLASTADVAGAPASRSTPVMALAGDASDGAPAAEAAAIATRFHLELAGRLQAELVEGGPAHAVGVCHEAAPAIARRLSAETGWEVKRVGTRVRNAARGTPDAWERARLDEFAARLAAGEKPEALTAWAEERVPAGTRQRFTKAIAVGPLCVTCHGDPAAQPAALRERLRALYPADEATGYRVGELRGAFVLQRLRPSRR
mgnify:CR=1 FL=1